MPNAPHHATGRPSGLPSAVRKDALIQSILVIYSVQPLEIALKKGHNFLDVRVLSTVFGNFSSLMAGTWATYLCSGAGCGWPDSDASEEYQTQSYFCLASGSPPDGSQGLQESPAAQSLILILAQFPSFYVPKDSSARVQ